MKSASFFYPYDSVLRLLQIILTRNGCTILSVNSHDGTIKATTEKKIFKKPKMIDLKIEKKEKDITTIMLSVNSNAQVYEKAATEDETMEEELLNVIDKYF